MNNQEKPFIPSSAGTTVAEYSSPPKRHGRIEPNNTFVEVALGHILARAGRRTEAEKILENYNASPEQRTFSDSLSPSTNCRNTPFRRALRHLISSAASSRNRVFKE